MTDILDPELAAVAAGFPRLDLADLAGAREIERRFAAHVPAYDSSTALAVKDLLVPGPQQAPDVAVRVYSPADRVEPLPALLYLHGGAYVMGGLDLIDPPARLIADRAGVVVVTVAYRLAPEHPYPSGLEDCYAALEWLSAEGADVGVDPGRIGVLGESAGGGLAAALALLARDRGGPRLIAQFLDAPTVDDRMDTPSMRDLPDTPTWQAMNSAHGWRHYLRGTAEPGSGDVPVHAAPARARVQDLVGLPPAWAAAYQVDPTRDEGIDYACLLMQAGVPTELHHYSEAFHVAHIIPGTAIGARMIADRIEAVRRLLRTAP
ncbi:alpha/beta hydrolase [Planotetraspora kaengkrachanensis]|uniref:Esterase n=1 Tax=Planotetraspora kaengkrachanensis TaxID=575193 RepID=A0A8J3LTM3_9ACTN|nr:alpha/beta hydrolase [Planotetraspora kaengkrachanensis]GIG77519.1 esterase [Planotetraspora kaengkrachanensis]